MKISAKKTEEWREVKEEGLEFGLKKYVLFKGDIPSKRVQYRDPAGKSYRNLSQALKQLNKTKSKGKKWIKTEWIQYCQENRLDEVKACLSLKVDVNTVSEDGQHNQSEM